MMSCCIINYSLENWKTRGQTEFGNFKLSYNCVIWFRQLKEPAAIFTNNMFFFFYVPIHWHISNKLFPVFWKAEGTVSFLFIVVNDAGVLLATTTCWPTAAMQGDHTPHERTVWRTQMFILQHIRTHRRWCAEVHHIKILIRFKILSI